MFDVKYTPELVDDINLIDIKNRCRYAVFTNTLLIDKGNSLVRKYEGDYNIHAIHKGVMAHISTSTKAIE